MYRWLYVILRSNFDIGVFNAINCQTLCQENHPEESEEDLPMRWRLPIDYSSRSSKTDSKMSNRNQYLDGTSDMKVPLWTTHKQNTKFLCYEKAGFISRDHHRWSPKNATIISACCRCYLREMLTGIILACWWNEIERIWKGCRKRIDPLVSLAFWVGRCGNVHSRPYEVY